MYFICPCENIFEKNDMKSHYRQCEDFKKNFDSINKNISGAIKHYIDNLNVNNKVDYVNKLNLLEFLFKRYVNLIREKINQKITDDDLKFTNAQNSINQNNEIINNLNLQKYKSSNLINHIYSTPKNSNGIQKNYSFPKLQKIPEKADITFQKISDYCEKINENNTTYDEELIKIMSYSISALTSRECFLMFTQNSKLITSEDEQRQFYNFNFKDINFFVVLY